MTNLTADSMIQKYQIKGFADKVLFKQLHKLMKDPESLIYKMIGNLTWMMLIFIPSMALIFKLLYVRRKKYYVEHLVFLFHTHAFFLFVGTVFLMFMQLELMQPESFQFLGLIFSFYFYVLISLKRVYSQGWIKTFFKLLLILFVLSMSTSFDAYNRNVIMKNHYNKLRKVEVQKVKLRNNNYNSNNSDHE